MNRADVISAGSRPAAEAARRLLLAGGNAFDAAVGAVFASMISEPALTGPAGGGHLMAVPASGSPVLYDFFVDVPLTPADGDIDFFRVTVNFGTATQDFHIGRGAVATPGTAAGLLAVHDDLGALPVADVLSPAIELAKAGTPLSATQAEFVKVLQPILTHDRSGRKLFAPEGEPLRAGHAFRNPALAETLRQLVGEGSQLLYTGEIGRKLAGWREQGGLIEQTDLEAYRVVRREPLHTEFAGYTVLLNPAPAEGGRHLAALLDSLAGAEPELSRIVAALEPLRPRREPAGAGSTTHVSVLDRFGNAASVTTTNGEGCGCLLDGTGVMPNNMLGEADLNPGGFHRGSRGSRLSSAMAPTIVLRGGEPVLLTGSSGSERIRSALLQVLCRQLLLGEDISSATEAPRAHLEGETLHVEPGLGEELLAALSHPYSLRRWPEPSIYFGGVNSATPDGGAADSRRGGCSLIVEHS